MNQHNPDSQSELAGRLPAKRVLNMVDGLSKNKRWDFSQADRDEIKDFIIESVRGDICTDPWFRLKAADVASRLEAQNQTDEKIGAEMGKVGNNEPNVILLLPSNGTEVVEKDG